MSISALTVRSRSARWRLTSSIIRKRLQMEIGQLETLIAEVTAHPGGVAEEDCFCNKWESGRECAEYLSGWLCELRRAVAYHLEGCPSPAQRLAEAQQKSDDEYGWEIHRLVEEATHDLYRKHEV